MPATEPCVNNTQQYRFTKLLCFQEIREYKKQWTQEGKKKKKTQTRKQKTTKTLTKTIGTTETFFQSPKWIITRLSFRFCNPEYVYNIQIS